MKQITELLMSAACIALCVTLYSCNNAFHEATGATSSGGGGKPTGTGEPAPPPPAGPVTLQSIAVTSPPSRNRFFVGEILDTVTLAGIVVTGYYSDSSEQDLTSQASFSVPDDAAREPATATATASVDGKTAPFTITLYELPKTIYIGDPNSGGAGYDTLNDAIAAAADGSTITLYEDMEINNITGLGNKTLTISGYGTTAKEITHTIQGAMFNLSGTDKLILAGMISLDGAINPHNMSNPLVSIAGTAALEMYDFATITGNIGGSGVSIGGGSLTMNDNARISGNDHGGGDGGGVSIWGGSLTMNGEAQISDNQAGTGSGGNGGGVYMNNGSLFMNDSARISDNRVGAWAGGVYVQGSSSSLTMNDNARITNNQASQGGGVYIMSGTFAITAPAALANLDPNIATSSGDKVYKYTDGIFTIDGTPATGGSAGGTGASGNGDVYWD